MSLPRKTMEQCRLCPEKLWSNANFSSQNHGFFVLCLAKLRSIHYLPANYGAMQTLPAKSKRHSFRGKIKNRNYLINRFSLIVFIFFCKSMLPQRSLQPSGPVFKENVICVTVPLSQGSLLFSSKESWCPGPGPGSAKYIFALNSQYHYSQYQLVAPIYRCLKGRGGKRSHPE